MKWVTRNYKGEKRVWYSGDVINKIISECEKQICEECDSFFGCECLPKTILDILENEESEDKK